MTTQSLMRMARLYAAAVGSMDFLTGIGLVITPAVTLRLMGADVPDAAAWAFVRFVGVFVGAVGASYLWAARAAPAALRTTLTVTLFFRTGAGTYAGIAVMTGQLGPAWLAVAATDLACVAAQGWMLSRGVGRDE